MTSERPLPSGRELARLAAARLAALGVLAVATVAAAGCGDGDSSSADAADGKVETTRVEVLEGSGDDKFNPDALYRRLSPGVVTIISRGGGRSLLDGGEGGLGSGFVLDDEGYVATNAHVVLTGGRGSKRAEELYVEFADGNRVAAKVVGDDPNADVALLKVDPDGLTLRPLALGTSADLVVGEPVAAIGSPFGERSSMTVGIVSAVDRAIESLTDFRIGNAIQTDAAINPGNSGGPLLNAEGKVIGINQQIKSQSGGGEGVGFAVPVDVVRRSLKELRENGKVDYGYLGVESQALYPQLAKRLDLPVDQGALIGRVQDGSPADEAGLSAGDDKITFQGQDDIPSDGDVIVAVDGKELTRTKDLADTISLKHAGDEVELTVLRDGDEREIKVKLGKRPREVTRP